MAYRNKDGKPNWKQRFQVCRLVARRCGCTVETAQTVIDTWVFFCMKLVANGQRVTWRSFGSFYPKFRAGRENADYLTFLRTGVKRKTKTVDRYFPAFEPGKI